VILVALEQFKFANSTDHNFLVWQFVFNSISISSTVSGQQACTRHNGTRLWWNHRNSSFPPEKYFTITNLVTLLHPPPKRHDNVSQSIIRKKNRRARVGENYHKKHERTVFAGSSRMTFSFHELVVRSSKEKRHTTHCHDGAIKMCLLAGRNCFKIYHISCTFLHAILMREAWTHDERLCESVWLKY
jgi:hypothetical protein